MKRKTSECCSAERPVKRKTPECRSAEQPARPVACNGSAERPASVVAYIDCPRQCWHRSPILVSRAVQNAVDVGATIINVTVDREIDAKVLFGNIYGILEAAWGEEFSSVSAGAVMSFYEKKHWEFLDSEEIDPEFNLPALMLTLRERQSPGLQMSVVTLYLPTLPKTTRDRLARTYIDKAVETKSHRIIIGGVFDAVANTNRTLLWLENHINKLAMNIGVTSNESLCVLPWCTTGSMKCTTLDTKGPYAMVIEHEPNSAEKLVALTSTKAPHVFNSARGSIAEQLAASTLTKASRGSNNPKRSSAEQPSASTATKTSRASLVPRGPGIILKEPTPLYDKLLDDLEHTEESSALFDHIRQHCFFNDLRFVTLSGYRAPGAMSFSAKMENLLRISLERRSLIAKAAGLTSEQLLQHRASPSEMKDMYNDWRRDVRAWMSTDNRERYFDLLSAGKRQKAHQLGKQCFTTYCFHVSGCRFLLGKLIELPIISTANRNTATLLSELLQDLEDHKKTDEYKAAVTKSEARSKEQQKLSRAIWWATSNLEKGRLLSTKVSEGKTAWSSLSTEEQQLVEDFDCRKLIKALIKLEASKSPVYCGTHVETFTA